MKRNETLRLVLSALFVALGVVLPRLAMLVPKGGSILLPMHIPVLLCGFICGAKYGLLSGLVTPFVAHLFNGMPPLYPTAISMACELAAYGFVSGMVYRAINAKLPTLHQLVRVLIALVVAMLAGRVVMAVANVVLLSVKGNSYTFSAFISGAFVTALPGIIVQLIVIPLIVSAMSKLPNLKEI